MTRKSLSDLVKMESQKPTDELNSSEVKDMTPESEEDHNKVELDAIAAKLKDVLAEAKHREDALQSEISRLKEEILDQKKHIANLQIELGQTDKLKHDFEEAKAVILRLSEANQLQSEPVTSGRLPSPTGQIITAQSGQSGQSSNSETDIGSWLG
jgi:predicted  nucleic acid-binding Zn-ribbon protein